MSTSAPIAVISTTAKRDSHESGLDENHVGSLAEEERILKEMGYDGNDDEDDMPLTEEEIRWFNENKEKKTQNQTQQPKPVFTIMPAAPTNFMLSQPDPESETDSDSDSD